jgi:hypothetical protein
MKYSNNTLFISIDELAEKMKGLPGHTGSDYYALSFPLLGSQGQYVDAKVLFRWDGEASDWQLDHEQDVIITAKDRNEYAQQKGTNPGI